MKVKSKRGVKSPRHSNAYPPKQDKHSIVVTVQNDLNSSSLKPVRLTSLKYVSPLGNIVPKKEEEEKVTVEQKQRRSSVTRRVRKKRPPSKISKTAKKNKRKLKTKSLQAVNNKSTEDSVTLDVPAVENDDSVVELSVPNSVVQKQNVGLSHLPPVSTTSATESKSSNFDDVGPIEISDGTRIEVQPQVSTRRSTRQSQSTSECHVISDKSNFEFFHKKGKENLYQDVDKLNLSGRSVISIDDNDTNLVPAGHVHGVGNKDNGSSLNSIEAQPSSLNSIEAQSICKGSSVRNNLVAETVNIETGDHVTAGNASSCSTSSKNVVQELETIDLEPDDVTDLTCSTIVVSDEEDSTSNDIIVLGTPVVPSVPSYKAVSKKRGTGSILRSHYNKPPLLAPVNVPSTKNTTTTQDIIARAISQLKSGMGGLQMVGSASVNNAPFGQEHSSASASTSTSRTVQSPNSIYGSNIYNPCGKTVKTGLRPVIIDGSNVAMGHGGGTFFSTKGLEICINYFVKRGHKVFAFVPQFRRYNSFTRDPELLEKLHKEKLVIFTPSRFVDGQSDVPYDDRYIVQTAAELGGVIVSTDNFRDLLQENVQWHDTIKNRLLMFTWVEDLLIFPQDPLGRRGGGLDEFLRF